MVSDSKIIKKDGKFCSVPNCFAKGTDIPRLSFHKFPLNETIKNNWVEALNLRKTPTKYMVICRKHFQEKDFHCRNKYSKRWILKEDAIPNQNIDENSEIFLKERKQLKIRGERKIKNFKERKLGEDKMETKNIEMTVGKSISSQIETNDNMDSEFSDESSIEELSTQLNALEAEKQILTHILENLNTNTRKERARNTIKTNNASVSSLKQRFFVLKYVTTFKLS